ncbi:MAG: DUF262 domain-containing protein [Candidatus Marinimicrobia bacterium]|nr:DUF262 domain-containing protein [Candidatus Neomarinimicrobiota bacterium]
MHASEGSLRTLLEGPVHYVAPSFQPRYTWHEDRWTPFIEGLFELLPMGNDPDFFLGAIALMPLEAVGNLRKFLLVDGQQRLITVLALMAAMRDRARGPHPALAQELESQCLLNPGQDGSYRFKVLPHARDRGAFFAALAPDTPPAEHPFAAYRFFQDVLEQRATTIGPLPRLAHLLLDQFKIVRIELDADENPYPIFRSLNAGDRPGRDPGLEAYSRFSADPTLMALIAEGESQHLEFKVSALGGAGDESDLLRRAEKIVRAVAGFLNSTGGGTLLIGVGDDGALTGIQDEYDQADPQRANWDGYQLFLQNILRSRLGIENPFQWYRLKRHIVLGAEICRLIIQPAPAPVYVDKRLYVRTGNQTIEMRGPDLVAYVQYRWPGPA